MKQSRVRKANHEAWKNVLINIPLDDRYKMLKKTVMDIVNPAERIEYDYNKPNPNSIFEKIKQ